MNTKVAVTDAQIVSPWVVLARHAVAIAALLAIYAMVVPKGYSFLDDWFVAVLLVLFMAGLVAGLAALFFTASQKSKWATNARNTAWVVTGLLLADPVLHALTTPSVSKVPATEAASPKEEPVPAVATEAAPASSPDPSFARAMDTAVGAILVSARTAGTIDYGADPEAAKQFDGYLAELVANPAYKGKSAAEIAQAAHQSVLAFRGIADNSARPAALPLGQIAAATGCARRPGETSESRREKLMSVRKEYPFLADRDDVSFVEALHQALYKDLPLACVADALGVALPAARTY